MIKEEKSTVISAGSEEITGSEIVKGVYKKPAASVQITKKITVNLEDNITKIFFQTHFIYKEATTKKDKPHFTLVAKLNGEEIDRAVWSDPDVYYEFEEHEGFLQVEIDLKKFYLRGEKRLEFETHLECWLEEQSWSGGAIKETASAYDYGNIIVNLGNYVPPGPEPEISLKIFPTHSPGEDKANYINTDWGEPYRLELSSNNKTDFTLKKSSSFELFEDRVKREVATLGKDLNPKQKIIIQTVKKAKTKATWEIQKDNSPESKNTPDYFEWYEDIGGGEFGIKQKNKIYKYYATGYAEASNAGPWNLKTDEISVNVRVPDYKIEAMNTYNDVLVVKNHADLINAVLGIGGGAAGIGAGTSTLIRKVLASAARVAAFLAIPIIAVTLVISTKSPEILADLKTVVDDPPVFNKNYKILVKLKSIKTQIIPKNEVLKRYSNFEIGVATVAKLLRACNVTNDRYWTAKFKRDKKYIKLQKIRLQKYKKALKLKIVKLSKEIFNLAKIIKKTNVTDISNTAKKELIRLGFNSKQIKKLKILHIAIIKNKNKLPHSLIRLSKKFRKFGDSYV